MDALVVRARQQLRDEVVRAADERLALHLADHVVDHAVDDLREALLELARRAPPLAALGPGQQAVARLELDAPAARAPGDLCAQHRVAHDARLHRVREAREEHGLPDDLVVRAPARAVDVQADLAHKVERVLAEARHGVDQLALLALRLLQLLALLLLPLLRWRALRVAARVQRHRVAVDRIVRRRRRRRLLLGGGHVASSYV